MATIEDFESRIREMAKYYIDLPEHVKNDSDMDYALMAKESSEDILSIVEKYKMNPKNTYLKALHSCLMTLTRGVEYFQDTQIQLQHRAFGKLRAELYTFLGHKIKW